ncbi:MAG: mannose-6-phosphate isomerase [Pelagibacteraceae bacterium]|jgi:mannose-1-phosphate guanylyltransferase/mannose-6-phosphate isomerase|nr:mannose-6-phosphate isomerase [Pelagibacteraceae bacterium]
MKIKPVILCGGSGTRLFPGFKHVPSKQFIDFGGWTLFEKTLDRIKNPIFDTPIISTNKIYKDLVLKALRNKKVLKYKIVLESSKKNTAAAIISSSLLDEIKINQPILFIPSDHFIQKKKIFNNILLSNIKNLNNKNIFIFGIKPTTPRSDYGYLLNKKIKKNINKVVEFIEKPKKKLAEKLVKKKALWNSGIVLARKDSIINNVKIYQKNLFSYCLKSLNKVNQDKKIIRLNKRFFDKITAISFDYAILEKAKEINSISLNISWSDLGSWSEIFKVLKTQIKSKLIKKNTFYRPWGFYKNYFEGEKFLLKELTINGNSSISLQKHFYRSEHWTVTQGKPKITIGKKVFFKNINESVFVPKGSIHRIENIYKKPIKIVEAQLGNILKETDIVRFQDIYGRIK